MRLQKANVSSNDSTDERSFPVSLKASLCTRKRGRDRRRKWSVFRSQRYADWPADKVWILGRLADAATSHSCTFGSNVRSFLATTTVLVGRCRDILTTPLLKKQRAQASELDTFPSARFSNILSEWYCRDAASCSIR